MANLPESASFDAGVYQIETTDAVIGGVNGISNLQAKALANRTTWLKQQVDALNLLKGKGIGEFSAVNSYAGGDQVVYQKNIWQANTSITPGAFNPANWTRQLGNAAEVDISTTAPAALGNSAVGASTTLARSDHVHAMPTLDALANTLITSNANGEILRWNGTNWINNTLAEAGIAPVASPTFTGVPACPTAAAGTNTTQIATTAFATAVANSALSGRVLKAGDTMTGQLVLQRNGTLNDLNTCALQIQAADDAIIWFNRPGLFSVALGVDATNNLVYGGGGSTLGAVYQVFHNGNCPKSFAANGYQKLASGLIIQWGAVASIAPGATATVTFPIAFPNACSSFVVTGNNVAAGLYTYSTGTKTTTGNTIVAYASNTGGGSGADWIAIGY